MIKSDKARKIIFILAAGMLLGGCTIHPAGESRERASAARAGRSFIEAPERRKIPPLPANPTSDQLVDFALQTNAGLEAKYWEWRSAIEQIPQDGTQPSTLALSANLSISRGRTGLGQSVLSAGNDPMADIVFPSKLSAAARRALEHARAAGLRFGKARLELRARVLNAWYDYAGTGELIRLEEANGQLLRTTSMVVEARSRAGAAPQRDLLKARNEVDLSDNDLAALRAQLPAQRAALNALLDRDANAPLPASNQLPPQSNFPYTDRQVLVWAAERNPELASQERELAAGADATALARLQYVPDISLTVGSDLKGIAQSLMGMLTVPLLRHEAIDAAITQAEANRRSTEATRRQTQKDLAAQVLLDLNNVRDADRELDLLEHGVLPRAAQIVVLGRSAYEAGSATLLDLLDGQRSLLSLRRLVANLRIGRLKHLADLEALTGHTAAAAGTNSPETAAAPDAG